MLLEQLPQALSATDAFQCAHSGRQQRHMA